ncbi:hypothetical protein RhiirA4_406992, partial [Rhizophagus irregularis]
MLLTVWNISSWFNSNKQLFPQACSIRDLSVVLVSQRTKSKTYKILIPKSKPGV